MNIDELYTVEHHEKGAEMQVKDQFGKKTDFYITLAGVDSIQFRKAKMNLQRAILNDPEGDKEKFRIEAVADITLGWRGLASEGKPVEFSKDMVINIYSNAPYVMEQADEFINNRVNFTKR